MKYYVYKITNLLNDHYYIGKRKHVDPVNDKYMGSGSAIKQAIIKHGLDNFHKTIITVFDNEADAYTLEASLVTKTVVADPMCYNLHEGGAGGFNHINSLPAHERPNILKIKQLFKDGLLIPNGSSKWSPEGRERVLQQGKLNREKRQFTTCTEFTKIKRQNTFKQIQHQQGFRNSNYGKVWCVQESATDCTNRKSFSPDNIPTGWVNIQIWREHRKDSSKANYGKKWYNDGLKNYLLFPHDNKVEYLVMGRLMNMFK